VNKEKPIEERSSTTRRAFRASFGEQEELSATERRKTPTDSFENCSAAGPEKL